MCQHAKFSCPAALVPGISGSLLMRSVYGDNVAVILKSFVAPIVLPLSPDRRYPVNRWGLCLDVG